MGCLCNLGVMPIFYDKPLPMTFRYAAMRLYSRLFLTPAVRYMDRTGNRKPRRLAMWGFKKLFFHNFLYIPNPKHSA